MQKEEGNSAVPLIRLFNKVFDKVEAVEVQEKEKRDNTQNKDSLGPPPESLKEMLINLKEESQFNENADLETVLTCNLMNYT